MAYSQGGLIEATDYNNLINGSNQLNTVWGTGFGDAGYGQPAISTVSATNTVTATQWATLINRLNSVRRHQSGVGSGITAVTAGQTINHLSTLQTQVNTAFTNRGAFAAQGSTLIGTVDTTNPFNNSVAAYAGIRDTNVTFSSANAARYFFNAGGQINFFCIAGNNGIINDRNNTIVNMINQVGGLLAFRNNSNGGRAGSGGTIVTNNTNFGYRQAVFNSATTIVNNDVAGTYSGHDVQLQVFSQSADYSNGSNGNSIVFRLYYSVPADDAFGGEFNIILSTRTDIVFPSTTHLTNVWGTPTINFDSA
jgi:hypothetical protein